MLSQQQRAHCPLLNARRQFACVLSADNKGALYD